MTQHLKYQRTTTRCYVFSNLEFVLSIYPRVLVKMRMGGMSNHGFKNIITKVKEDYRAIKKNKSGGIGTLVLKNLSKIQQFIV